MLRKRKTKNPCAVCFLHESRCICDQIPKLDLKTKVVLVIHAKEMKRTTNTGLLATKSLINSEVRIRGLDHEKLDLSDLLASDYRTLLFFPTENAVELNAEFMKQDHRPIQLIVPDGNWRQASKVHYRHSELSEVPRVMINSQNLSKYFLRAETTAVGMATLQAVAEALGVIEGPKVKEILLNLYKAKLNATLLGRGLVVDD